MTNTKNSSSPLPERGGQRHQHANRLAEAKQVVTVYQGELDHAMATGNLEEVRQVLAAHTVGERYMWQAVHPFDEQLGANAVAEVFYRPLLDAFRSIQRRPDVFLAGMNRGDMNR